MTLPPFVVCTVAHCCSFEASLVLQQSSELWMLWPWFEERSIELRVSWPESGY